MLGCYGENGLQVHMEGIVHLTDIPLATPLTQEIALKALYACITKDNQAN